MSTPRENGSLSEKHNHIHAEHARHDDRPQHASDDENTFEVEEESLPPGYFTSPFFLGSMTAISTGLVAGVAGFGYIAPILNLINNDIGPVSSPSKSH